MLNVPDDKSNKYYKWKCSLNLVLYCNGPVVSILVLNNTRFEKYFKTMELSVTSEKTRGDTSSILYRILFEKTCGDTSLILYRILFVNDNSLRH